MWKLLGYVEKFTFLSQLNWKQKKIWLIMFKMYLVKDVTHQTEETQQIGGNGGNAAIWLKKECICSR